MKTWTVVIEIQDDGDPSYFEKSSLEQQIERGLSNLDAGLGFRIMETIEAHYGPQYPNGVRLIDSGSYVSSPSHHSRRAGGIKA